MVGGHDSKPHHYELHQSDGGVRELKTKEILIPVEPGDTFVIRSAGGGGWGDPTKRSPEARAADLLNGIVTAPVRGD